MFVLHNHKRAGSYPRFNSPDDIESLVRTNWAQGISRFFITDDNFARNKNWEAVLDRLIWLRETQGIPLGLLVQVDTLCHKIPNFIEKCKRAGVTRVFIGLENINPDNLLAAKKRQNKITEYRKMLLAWKDHGIMTLAGYILGFPGDTVEFIRRILRSQARIAARYRRVLLPHSVAGARRIIRFYGNPASPMDPGLNSYDLEHVCTAHSRMSISEWAGIYNEAWSTYYSPDHMEVLLVARRCYRH